MDFALTEEQVAIRDMVEGFAAERLAPNTGRWDREAHFPLDEMRELAGLGLAACSSTPRMAARAWAGSTAPSCSRGWRKAA
jgi:alkylation response protein AidB-like acyl-CoA dehydrogenase